MDALKLDFERLYAAPRSQQYATLLLFAQHFPREDVIASIGLLSVERLSPMGIAGALNALSSHGAYEAVRALHGRVMQTHHAAHEDLCVLMQRYLDDAAR